MKTQLQKGQQLFYQYQVKQSDIAAFESGVVHQVCSTFALAREMEWSSRLFVLQIKEVSEEGIGTELHILHHSPAFVGEELQFTATVLEHTGHKLLCDIAVQAGNRLIATGQTGQKIISKARLAQLLTPASNG